MLIRLDYPVYLERLRNIDQGVDLIEILRDLNHEADELTAALRPSLRDPLPSVLR